MDGSNSHAHAPRDVFRLVDEQVLKWNARERPIPGLRPYWPVVTISREYGSQGAALGKRVAHRLGFTYWDRELVASLAETLRVGEVAVSQLDEHVRRAVEDVLRTVLFQQPIMALDYADELRKLLLAIQKRGSAVIIGRGSHSFLAQESSLRVRVVCPFNVRVAALRTRKGLSEAAAVHELRAEDAQRVEFVRRTFGADVTDPTCFDVVVNTHTLEPEKADEVVLAAYRVKFGRLPEVTRGVQDESTGLRAGLGEEGIDSTVA